MSIAVPIPPPVETPTRSYLSDGYSIGSWLLTKDHKRIGVLYLISITLFMTGARFEARAAPYRGVALAITVAIAYKTKSAVTGMLIGMVLVLISSWVR